MDREISNHSADASLRASPSSQWSGSITPPLDDFEDEFIDGYELESQAIVAIDKGNTIPSFPDQDFSEMLFLSCEQDNERKGISLRANDYIESGALNKFLKNTWTFQRLLTKRKKELFGIQLNWMNYGTLILHLRKHFQEFLNSYLSKDKQYPWSDTANTGNYRSFIEDVKLLSGTLIAWLLRFAMVPVFQSEPMAFSFCYSSFERDVIHQYGLFVSMVGRAHRNLLWSNSVRRQKDALLHIYLNISIYFQLMLAAIRNKAITRGNVIQIEEHTYSFIADIFELSHKIFQENLGMEQLYQTSAFPCSCVKEALVVQFHIRQHFRHEQEKRHSDVATRSYDNAKFDLSNSLHWLLFYITNDISRSQRSYRKKMYTYKTRDGGNFLSFKLWLMKNVAELEMRDLNFPKEQVLAAGTWSTLSEALDEIAKDGGQVNTLFGRLGKEILLYGLHFWEISKGSGREFILKIWEQVQCFLVSSVTTAMCNPSTNLRALSDLKDSSFKPSSLTLTASLIKSYTPYEWIEKCKRYDGPCEVENDTFFDIFMRNLVTCLNASYKEHQDCGWDKIKARFYSKFYRKRMQEFGEFGLHNFITLSLTLVSATKEDSTAKRMVSFLGFVNDNSFLKREMVIKAYFGVLHILKEERYDTKWMSEILREKLKDLCMNFKELPLKASKRYECSKLIWFYFDCLEKIIDGGAWGDMDYILMDSDDSFKVLFQHTSSIEFQRLMDFLHTVISSQYIHPRQDTSMNKKLLAFLTQTIHTLLASNFRHRLKEFILVHGIADLAAAFTSLALKCQRTLSSSDFNIHHLLQLYLSDSLDSRFLLRYIVQLVSGTEQIQEIAALGLEGRFINVWLRLSIQQSCDSNSFNELTSVILRLPTLSSLLGDKKTELNCEKVVLALVVSLGDKFDSLTHLQDIIDFKKRLAVYLDGICNSFETVMQPKMNSSRLRFAFALCGKLIRHLSKALYSKSLPGCLLPSLLNMILPLVPSNKPLDPNVMRNITVNLHRVLLGLSALDFTRDDFVKRKIKEIFARFFLITTEKCRLAKSHANPFVLALKNSVDLQPPREASDFRQHVMQIVSQHFIVMPQPPTKLHTALFYLHTIFENTLCEKEIIRNAPIIINQVLGCLLACDACEEKEEPPGIRALATSILDMVCKAFSTKDKSSRLELVSCFKEFLGHNISQFQNTVFKALEACKRYLPAITEDLEDFLLEPVCREEEKRGIESCKSLREAYEKLLLPNNVSQ